MEIQEKLMTEVREPSKYNVIMYNDDFTSMDFVVYVLRYIYEKDKESAQSIMMNIHNMGSSVVGTYSKDGAATRVDETIKLARVNNFPLKVEMEVE